MAERMILNDVREGMFVYDKRGEKIGEITFIQNGVGVVEEMPDIVWLKNHLDEILDRTTNLPNIFYKDMFRDGFIRVRRGFFKSDVIIVPQQIMDYLPTTVFLDVNFDELYEC